MHAHLAFVPLMFAFAFAARGGELGVQSAVIIRFPHPSLFQSPYTWRTADGSAIAPTGGAYLKGIVSGTGSIKANIDTSINAGLSANDMPTLKVTIDDEPAAFVQFPPGAKQVTLANVSPEKHRYRLEVIGGNQGTGDGWGGISFQTKIDSLEFDSGAVLSPPAIRPKRALILGDSNIQAYFGERSEEPYYKYVDYTLAWPGYVAAAFECEFGLRRRRRRMDSSGAGRLPRRAGVVGKI